MTTKVLTGTYTAGYVLAYPITTLSIAAGGYVEGEGVATAAGVHGRYHLVNDGRVVAAAYLEADGVDLANGGVVINGGGGDQTALISGFDGVYLGRKHDRVRNYGTIAGLYYDGIVLTKGGMLINGSASDTRALVSGYQNGVTISGGACTVMNFGTIVDTTIVKYGLSNAGLIDNNGGSIVNGTRRDTTAVISGFQGVLLGGHNTTVDNYGTISADTGYGVEIFAGGVVINGSRTDQRALIKGQVASRYGPTTITNFGRIIGDDRDAAVSLNTGEVINGSAQAPHALIEGFEGVQVQNGVVTVINFGTIWSHYPEAVGFSGNQTANDRLIVEAGSALVGYAGGGGQATLELANGVGTIAAANGQLSAGDNSSLSIYGSMPSSRFRSFGTLQIDAGARFADKQLVSIAAGLVLNVEGRLGLRAASGTITNAGVVETGGAGVCRIDAVLVNSGTLSVGGGVMTVTGAASGAGATQIMGGTLDLASSASLNVTFNGPGGSLALGASRTYAGTITGLSQTGSDTLDLGDIAFVGAGEATFSGTASAGVLTVSDGAHTARITLAGDYLDATFVASDDGAGGVDVIAMPAAVPAAIQRFTAAAAALSHDPAAIETPDHGVSSPERWALARPVQAGQRLA